MKTATELQLRKIALVLAGILLLQLVWSGVSLLLVKEPEPVVPAEASLQVDEIRYQNGHTDELAMDMVSRPVFWQGRQRYFPPPEPTDPGEPEKPARNSNIDAVALQGIYSAGNKSGIIISYKDERHRLQPDESVGGWTFIGLGGDGAIFASGSDRKELPLEHALSGPSPKADIEETPRPDKSDKQDKTGE
ncbi:MAG: hypothetical protein R3E50_02665 [Halioglobus sp.]